MLKLKDKRQQDIVNFNISKKSGFIAVWLLFLKFYIKSFMGPFFGFLFPVVIYAILGSIMGYKIMFSGLAAMTALSTGLTNMPMSVMELKKSILLKRIGASPVKPSTFTLVIIVHYTCMTFMSVMWLMIWAIVFTQDTTMFKPLGEVVGFFGFLYGNIINIMIAITLGFMVSSFAKSEQSAQAIGMLIYFPSVFLSGQFLTPNLIAQSSTMNIISKFIPFRYSTMYLTQSWMGGNPFLIDEFAMPNMPSISIELFSKNAGNPTEIINILKHSIKPLVWWDDLDHIMGYVYPYVTIALATIVAIKNFSWSASR